MIVIVKKAKISMQIYYHDQSELREITALQRYNGITETLLLLLPVYKIRRVTV